VFSASLRFKLFFTCLGVLCAFAVQAVPQLKAILPKTGDRRLMARGRSQLGRILAKIKHIRPMQLSAGRS